MAHPASKGLSLSPEIPNWQDLNAIRFLTDHLNGDVYFRIRREAQNLDRFRAQLRLVELMSGRRDEMRAIVEQTWRDTRARAERSAKK